MTIDETMATAPSPARRARTTDAATSTASAAIVQPAPSTAAPLGGRVATRISLTTALVAIWAAGLLAVVGRLAVGLIAVRWMSRRTVRVVDAPWLPLAVELASSLGITRRLTFLESARATMPMAAGIFTPSVLMPEDANRWPLERLRIVLLHELAHVKRRDCLTHVIAQLACALHWFNPLAWIAARHIRTERERACDDLVLACGTQGPDYAEELLEIARVMRGGRYPALLAGATLAMAHRSQLEGRLIAILDPKVPRSGVSPARAALAAAAVACALPPLAAMQPWAVATVEATSATASSAASAEIETGAPQVTAAPDATSTAASTSARAVTAVRDRVVDRTGDRSGDRGLGERERHAGREPARAGDGPREPCRAPFSKVSSPHGRAWLRVRSRAPFKERCTVSRCGRSSRTRSAPPPILAWSQR